MLCSLKAFGERITSVTGDNWHPQAAPTKRGAHVMTMTQTDVYWDMYDRDIYANPHQIFTRLRREAPVYYNEKYNFYALSHHDDLARVLGDRDTFISGKGMVYNIITSGLEMPPGLFINEDPPMHTMHRGIVSRLFTPRAVSGLVPQIQKLCEEIVDGLMGREQFDFMKDFSLQLPVQVIGMLVGVPKKDQADLLAVFQKNLHEASADPEQDLMQGILDSAAWFNEYLDWREKNPSDDVMTQLMQFEFEDETGTKRTLRRDEIVTYLTLITAAGSDTTATGISWAGALLNDHPDQRRELTANPDLIPQAFRGGAADGVAVVPLLPLVDEGHRVPRGHHSQGQRRRGAAGGGEPRREQVGGLAALRHPSQAGPDLHLQLRPALLPRGQPGQARGPDRAGDDPQAHPGVDGRLRQRGVHRRHRHARLRAPAGLHPVAAPIGGHHEQHEDERHRHDDSDHLLDRDGLAWRTGRPHGHRAPAIRRRGVIVREDDMDRVDMLWELEQIKRLKSRYYRLQDQDRWDEWALLFTDDCEIADPHDPSVKHRSGAAIAKRTAETAAITSQRAHRGTMPDLEIIDERTAKGTWALGCASLLPNGDEAPTFAFIFGYYTDEYRKGDDGQWRIHRMQYDNDMTVVGTGLPGIGF
jgi:cytochrome P450